MSDLFLTELKKAKLKLYALLLSKKAETLTHAEVETSYALSFDDDIQQVFERERSGAEEIRK